MDDENGRWIRWAVAGFITAVVLLVAIFPGRSLYRHLEEKHSAAQARAFLAKDDYRNAFLGARRALLINSNNVEGCRIMTELYDAAHSPAALDWCRRLVKLSPAVTNQLLLASLGLKYQSPPYPITSRVLAELPGSAAHLPAFHLVSGELDLSLHRMAEAGSQFAAACRLEPTNRLFQLNLAVVRLGSTDTATAAAARAQLKEFIGNPELGPPALRSLIADRLLHHDYPAALDYSTQLLAAAQATLGDRLQHLGILKLLKSPALTDQLNALQRDAATNATMAAQTVFWMEANGLQSGAVRWLNTLPAGIQKQNPVRLAYLDCYANSTNWPAMRQLTLNGDWGRVDYLRLAFLSRAWSKLDQPVMADGAWGSAVNEASERLGALTELLELVNRWQMSRERSDLLWRIVRGFPDARWAQDALQQLYFEAGDTAGLYKLYARQFSHSPRNVGLENNLAYVALLLKTNLTQAGQWAADAYAQAPTNADVAATYAYALHLQGRNRDALATLQKLTPAQLKEPSVALYYGLLLSATGQNAEAAPYLKISRTRGALLPEEKRLLTAAGG